MLGINGRFNAEMKIIGIAKMKEKRGIYGDNMIKEIFHMMNVFGTPLNQ